MFSQPVIIRQSVFSNLETGKLVYGTGVAAIHRYLTVDKLKPVADVQLQPLTCLSSDKTL